MTILPPVCDYEGSDYQARFWRDQGRDYEDLVERAALRRLLPATGATVLDIGAGFGRLSAEFSGYQRVVLLDYSTTLLREAQTRLRHDPRFLYVAANWYQMPFVNGLFDTLVQVRTLHHAADAPALWRELARIARPGGYYVLEFANKHNLKAIARYALRRQTWSPFDHKPVEFVELNYNFHHAWIRRHLVAAGFTPGSMLNVSNFRLAWLKAAAPTDWLVRLDYRLQPLGRWAQLAPSLFVRSDDPAGGQSAPPGQFFACPICRAPLGEPTDQRLVCPTCQAQWALDDGLYNFKTPV